MSQDVYPSDIPGLAFAVVREVVPPPVSIVTTPSLREYRSRDASLTRYKYTLPYEFLRSAAPFTELSEIVNFYNDHGGPFDSWLFTDPDDHVVTGQQFGTGNGSNKVFQLSRQFGGANSAVYESIFDVAITPTIHLNASDGIKLNLLLNGDAFDGATWGGAATVTANTTTDPFGTSRADTVADTSSGDTQYRNNICNISNDTQNFRFSVFVKQTSGGTAPLAAMECDLLNGATPLQGLVILNTDTGTVVATTGPVTDVHSVLSGSGGFWRVDARLTNNKTGNVNAQIIVFPAYAPAASGTPAVRDPTITGSAIFYGAKIEVGSQITSYTNNAYTELQGTITMNIAPGANQALFWSGEFYRRCRFLGDSLETEKFMDNLWSAKSVEFIQTRS